jgi:glycosyltransferase involved in cell wall biosynthesis
MGQAGVGAGGSKAGGYIFRRELSMQLSVVLPVFNQGLHISGIVRGYRDALQQLGIGFELILVPNGCTDNSVAVCQELGREDARIRTVEVAGSGWGRAVISGLAAANGDLLCYTNTARTSAELLGRCVVAAMDDLSRVVKVTRVERRGSRYWGSALYNVLGRLLLGLRGRDMNGTPKVFPGTFQALRRLNETGDLLDLEFMVCCNRFGYQVQELEAPWGGRQGGVSTTSLRSAVRMYAGLMRFRLLWRQPTEVPENSGGLK